MNFKKAITKERISLKAILVINGKFDKGAIMREAWARARRLAALCGAQACEFFSIALKDTWAIAKA